MIPKGQRARVKMGQKVSKNNQRIPKESLMTQTSRLVGQHPQPQERSPPPTPRSLSATLASSQLIAEFRAFLHKLDVAQLGEEEAEQGRVLTLQYILDIRNLESCPESDRPAAIHSIGAKYFQVPGQGLELENAKLWVRCSEACSSSGSTQDSQTLVYLRKAHDSCLRELDEPHLLFLKQKMSASTVSQIINCLL